MTPAAQKVRIGLSATVAFRMNTTASLRLEDCASSALHLRRATGYQVTVSSPSPDADASLTTH
jgi:hypothetical protein